MLINNITILLDHNIVIQMIYAMKSFCIIPVSDIVGLMVSSSIVDFTE